MTTLQGHETACPPDAEPAFGHWRDRRCGDAFVYRMILSPVGGWGGARVGVMVTVYVVFCAGVTIVCNCPPPFDH